MRQGLAQFHCRRVIVDVILDEIALQNPKAKGYKPRDIIDTTIVKQLEQSGFVASIYR